MTAAGHRQIVRSIELVLYQFHALGAAGAPGTNPDVDATEPCGRGLAVLAGWLDHVADLGCSGVLLTPAWVSSTHGYDTVDPFRTDQRLGDEQDFDDLVEACHRRDLRLVLDGVFNHVGRDFVPFRDVRAHGTASAYADWFHLDPTGDDGDGFAYRCFEGHHELVTLAHDQPAVRDWATAVARHWLDRGADGWRFDAAYAMPRDFLADLVGRLRTSHPDAFLFGEVIHGDYAGFVADTGVDSVTQYELHKAIWSSLNDANLFELDWALQRHRRFTETFAPVTFVGNHDVTRLASRLHDPRHAAVALAVLVTLPGRPCVYYGDELGWTGVKEDRAGGDDAIRPPLPATADPVDPTQAEVLGWHRQLIGFRRARPWLERAGLEAASVQGRRMSWIVRAGDQAVHVTLDLDQDAPDPPVGWRPVATGPGFVIGEAP